MLSLSHDLKKLAELEDALSELHSIGNRTDAGAIVAKAFWLSRGVRETVIALLTKSLTEEVADGRSRVAKRIADEAKPKNVN